MPDATLFAMLSREQELDQSRAADVLRELAIMPAQKPLHYGAGVQFRQTQGEHLIIRLHYSAIPERDPEQNPEWKTRERKKYTSQASWDREQEIVDEAGGGELVFADTLLTHWNKIVITDPAWRPDPEWRVEGGGDHGKTNPTALVRCYVDFAGTIIFAGEYYQPGKEVWEHAPVMKKMNDFLRMDPCYFDRSIFDGTGQQQSQSPGHTAERAKTIGELYREQGIENFVPFYGDRSDVSFAARLQLHWANLDMREPTVKIVCRNYSDKPQFGLHQWDCPNLLWELMRTRRVKLTAQQLLSRNTSEAIVDKDNHARDACKYVLMSHPEPAVKSLERRVDERIAELHERSKQENNGVVDPTMAVIQYQRIMREEREEDEPVGYGGGNARRRLAQMARRRGRGR